MVRPWGYGSSKDKGGYKMELAKRELERRISEAWDEKARIAEIAELIQTLSDNGVTLERVVAELDYREQSISGNRWDDVLSEYSSAQLMKIERAWVEETE